jgi:hypothetical protein
VLPQPGPHLVADVPHLIAPAQGPRRMGRRQGDQPVASFFFRLYAGSGLVIQCLARCQRTPRRARARRMASRLTGREVGPSATRMRARSTGGRQGCVSPACPPWLASPHSQPTPPAGGLSNAGAHLLPKAGAT